MDPQRRQYPDHRPGAVRVRVGLPARSPTRPCLEGHQAQYLRVPRLLTDLRIAHGEGTVPKLYRDLARIELLILDDWGLAPIDAARARDLLEILDDRFGHRSAIVTSQLPVADWHRQLNDPTLADASSTVSFMAPSGSNCTARPCAPRTPRWRQTMKAAESRASRGRTVAPLPGASEQAEGLCPSMEHARSLRLVKGHASHAPHAPLGLPQGLRP